MNTETDSIRVGVVLEPRDVIGLDRAVADADETRSSWLRKLIRQRLRELNTTTKASEAAA